MKTLFFRLPALLLLTYLSFNSICLGEEKRPNILYIFTDDQSTRTVSCYPEAHQWVSTPNIDALAAKGVRFSSAYLGPFCVASRITQMTGNLPHAAVGNFNGVTLTGQALKDEIISNPFWVQSLRESGYHTGMIGKWHIYSRMPAVGIDWDYAAYWHKKMVNAYYYDQKISINGAEPIPLGGYSTDRYTDLAIDYLKDRSQSDKPWYLWLCYASPHSPQTPAKRHQGKIGEDCKVVMPRSFEFREGKPNYVQKKNQPKLEGVKSLVRRYHECILSIDENVGRLTDTLEATGQLANTLIIFTSDQGLAMGHHGHVKKKNAPYDANLTSPLIFRHPQSFPEGKVCKEPVTGADVVQTLHEITGVAPKESMDGVSLVPVIEKPGSSLKRDVMLMTNVRTSFSNSIPNGVKRRNREAIEIDEMPMWAMIRSGDFKYATYTGDEAFEEIYDLAKDPEELNNLANSSVHGPILTELRAKAAGKLKSTQSGFSGGHFIDYLPKLNGNQAKGTDGDLEKIRQRYLEWVLESADTDYANAHVLARLSRVKRRAAQAIEKWDNDYDLGEKAPVYDTRKAGADSREVRFLVTDALLNLAIAYQLKGPDKKGNPYYRDEQVKKRILTSFDRLHERGFCPGMLMPWKAKEAADEPSPPPQAIIVDFHLRTSGYALATFLMREELAGTDRLERSLNTCREIMGHDEKFGSLYDLKLNADGIRVAVNFSLPYTLAAGDLKHLKRLKQQVQRSMAKESDASDTIKPDGLGFHHRAVYLAGYASFGVAQSAFLAWLFDGTAYQCNQQTIDNLAHSMEVLRVVSQKYDMHKSLAGRLNSTHVIPNVLISYAWLADFDHDKRSQFPGMLARLADDSFMASPMAERALTPQRNEVPPGPGAIQTFLNILSKSKQIGAEPEPTGHWALNYGPISVHRRDNWMVSIKGFSKYLWAFERSLVDARLDARLQNVLGFHNSSAHIRIHNQGSPVNAIDSGYSPDGWDWCRIPGATTRLIPGPDLLEMDRQSSKEPIQRPFSRSSFAGGVALDGKHGVFGMQYAEVGPDRRKERLRAMKGVFFFGDEIVVISNAIQNGDGKYPVATTLYQTRLAKPDTVTWVQGRERKGLGEIERFETGKAVTLVDSVGNGYYIKRASNLVVRRDQQTHLGYDGLKLATDNFSTAWFDHGFSPEQEYCEYVILPSAGVEGITTYAKNARDSYSLLQKNSKGIIVEHKPLGLTGYVLPSADKEIESGVVKKVSAACLVMTREQDGKPMRFSVCNPDLGWESGVQYQYKKDSRDGGKSPPVKPVPMPVTLTLRGLWQLAEANSEISNLKWGDDTTQLRVATEDARSIEFHLKRKP